MTSNAQAHRITNLVCPARERLDDLMKRVDLIRVIEQFWVRADPIWGEA